MRTCLGQTMASRVARFTEGHVDPGRLLEVGIMEVAVLRIVNDQNDTLGIIGAAPNADSTEVASRLSSTGPGDVADAMTRCCRSSAWETFF